MFFRLKLEFYASTKFKLSRSRNGHVRRESIMSKLKVRSVFLLLVLSTCFIAVLPLQVSSQEEMVQVKIRTVNLNAEPLYNVTVDVYNATTSPRIHVMSEQTDEDGWVTFSLTNKTYYAFAASWEVDFGAIVHIGDLPERLITSNITIEKFNCSLASLRLTVADQTNTPLSFTDLGISFGYVTIANDTKSIEMSVVTDQTGTAIVSNMLVKANYTIEPSRYGFLFSKKFIQSLEPLLQNGWANVNIIAPTYALSVGVVDSLGKHIPQARVEADDFDHLSRGGLGITNNSGNVTMNLTVGKYAIRVYYDDPEAKLPVLLNETVADLAKDRSFVIHCDIFGIQPSLKLFDYLGQPIPNVMVEIERRVDAQWIKVGTSIKTNSDGTAPLPNIGGDYRVSMYMSGETRETRTVFVGKTEQVAFKLDGYTTLGGHLFATSQFITVVLFILFAVSFVSLLLYERFLHKGVDKKPIS